MNVTFRPLTVWPHPTTNARQSRWAFRAGWGDTLEKLIYEIDRLGGHDVVVAAGFGPNDIRNDGFPRSGARRPAHPGIEISFDLPPNGPGVERGRKLIAHHGGYEQARKATHPDVSGYDSTADFQAVMATREHGRAVFATDQYELWEHNVRAIALTLEALRAVDRYGATQGRQYAGFMQQITAAAGS